MVDPKDLLIDSAAEATETFKEFLGIREAVYSCDKCGSPCEETYAYNANTAAFDRGECPAWECPECSALYVRESDTGKYTADLYRR